jgi:hypothetical protein
MYQNPAGHQNPWLRRDRRDLQDQIEEELFNLNGVNYVDIETEILDNGEQGEAILLVGLKDVSLITEVEEDINRLVGDFIVKIGEFKIEFSLENQPPSLVKVNTSTYRPLIGGINIGSPKGQGTLGMCFPFSAVHTGYVPLSNQHVLRTDKPIGQPAGSSRIMQSDSRGVINTKIDANICIMDGVYNNFVTQEVLGIGVISNTEDAKIGMKVTKVGINTGKTQSTVDSITSTVLLEGHNTTLKNQIRVISSQSNPFQDKGDSGAALLSSITWTSSPNIRPYANITGLMFAKGHMLIDGEVKYFAFANQINDVASKFGMGLNGLVPLYGLYSGAAQDHMLVTNYYGLDKNPSRPHYSHDKTECRVWVNNTNWTNTIPFYRFYCSNCKDHFYTTDSSLVNNPPDGYVYENIACYVMKESNGGSYIPLYRYYCASNGDHYYTTSNVTPPNYVSEGIACYVMRH